MALTIFALAYSRPWHFWIGAAFLGMALLLLVGLMIKFYRQILVPFYSWMFNEDDDRAFALDGASANSASLPSLPQGRGEPADERRPAQEP